MDGVFGTGSVDGLAQASTATKAITMRQGLGASVGIFSVGFGCEKETALDGKLRKGLFRIKRSVYKPGSVRCFHRDGHFSRSTITRALQQPTRGVLIEVGALTAYLALLQLGFAMPFMLP